MNKFGMNQRMIQNHLKNNPFGRVPGMYPIKPVPKGVDGGHIGSLKPNQLHGIYGSLGNPIKPGVRKPGDPLKIQLLSPNAGGAAGVSVPAPATGTNTKVSLPKLPSTKSTATNNIFSAIRRRLVDGEEEEEEEGDRKER